MRLTRGLPVCWPLRLASRDVGATGADAHIPDPEHIERLKPFGEVSEVATGAVLLEEGSRGPDLIVLVEGAIDVFQIEAETRQETFVGGAIVLLSMTAVDAVIWETFDDAGDELQSVTTIDDFRRAFDKQGQVAVLPPT